jgi:adenylosuccinate synthase
MLLERARERLRETVRQLAPDDEEHHVFEAPPSLVIDPWLAQLPDVEILDERRFSARLAQQDDVIFEGAQGVLLDEWRGFHPYTTWSTCTYDNALEIAHGWDVMRIGVVRTYATRHGAGPFPTERDDLALPEPHNAHGPWQGAFRRGDVDLVLLRYAMEVCGRVDALAITHLDAPVSRVCDAYDVDGVHVERLTPGPFRDLEYQSELTRTLERSRPRTRAVSSVPHTIAESLGVRIAITSRGPTHLDVSRHGV